MEEQYYIQEPGYVGNSLIFYGPNNNGYVTNMAKAGKYSLEEATKLMKGGKDSLKLWPVSYIDSVSVINVDSQYVDSGFCQTKEDL